jgi:hypothetical protein
MKKPDRNSEHPSRLPIAAIDNVIQEYGMLPENLRWHRLTRELMFATLFLFPL